MEQVIYVLANVAYYLLWTIMIALSTRAVLSWFMNEEDNQFMYILVLMTEPLLIPFRLLFQRSEKMRSLPIDLSLSASMLTVMLLMFLVTLLV